MTAPDTDSWLVEHRYSNRLVCHLTGFSMPKPAACPHCGAKDSLTAIGPGVERLEEEARGLFPDARVAVFSSDTVMDAAGARALIARMAGGEIDILVATQAAAKGHNFPGLTLVGVVDADLGLRGGDLRAAERTYQLLAQVAGRAGRAERPGRALIQTYAPEHQVMQALQAGDRDGFLAAEAQMREASGLPPYGRLAALILSSPDAVRLDEVARALRRRSPRGRWGGGLRPRRRPPRPDPRPPPQALPGARRPPGKHPGLCRSLAREGEGPRRGAPGRGRGPVQLPLSKV